MFSRAHFSQYETRKTKKKQKKKNTVGFTFLLDSIYIFSGRQSADSTRINYLSSRLACEKAQAWEIRWEWNANIANKQNAGAGGQKKQQLELERKNNLKHYRKELDEIFLVKNWFFD